MSFDVKNWQDSPSTATPISAAALENLEERVTAYTDDTAQDAVPGVKGVPYLGLGDGVAQDATAFQNLLDDGGGFAPRGVYMIEEPLDLSAVQKSVLGGLGGGGIADDGPTILRAHADFPVNRGILESVPAALFNSQSLFKDLQIDCDNIARDGILFSKTSAARFVRVTVRNALRNGFRTEDAGSGASNVEFEDCYSNGADVAGFHQETIFNRMLRCVTDGGDYSVFACESAGALEMIGGHFEGAAVEGVHFEDFASGRLVAPYIATWRVAAGTPVDLRATGANACVSMIGGKLGRAGGSEGIGAQLESPGCELLGVPILDHDIGVVIGAGGVSVLACKISDITTTGVHVDHGGTDPAILGGGTTIKDAPVSVDYDAGPLAIAPPLLYDGTFTNAQYVIGSVLTNRVAATTLGAVTGKEEVFGPDGTSIGFRAIYDAIT